MNHKEFYLTTGKKDFEDLFCPLGGIRVDPDEGTTILIEGSAGVGKTTLAIEMIKNAILNNKSKCLYYIFDQTSKEIRLLLENFSWDDNIKIAEYQWYDINNKKDNLEDDFIIIETRSLDQLQSQLSSIKEHSKRLVNCNNRIIVIDSIGVNSKLSQLDRETFSIMLNDFKDTKSIIFLIREKDKDISITQNEYLTNVVIDLQVQKADLIHNLQGGAYTTTIEIKKTRNQPSIRGPHECTIKSSKNNNFSDSKNTGFIVYPSLQSIAQINELSRIKDEKVDENVDRALFYLEPLDTHIGEDGQKGIPYGQTILLKGPPGNHKTDLSLKFLFGNWDNERDLKSINERTLFVSCRLDKAALKTNELFKGKKTFQKFFFENMVFFDARESYKTPEMIMSLIKEKVEENQKKPIKRAVIFGIGMLETLPMFRGSALNFLQVLLSYFKTAMITSIWVDWMLSHDRTDKGGPPLLQTEFASHLVAAELTVEYLQPNEENTTIDVIKEENPQAILKLTRKNYRSYKKDLGILRMVNNELNLTPQ
ncbi:MAG: hypothetical protein IPP15_06565 [Saprospiraceae bacterium]|uniref:KaiC-like domain-containing protein n=1 Tax=Candidatus Opimibacter skivensis TaxID=2982028 RepID=A0A9D7SRQ4_9BACT|nr:hypothetical protein [Candidatus Opimibacter skivensis]